MKGLEEFHYMRAGLFLSSSCGDVNGRKPKVSKRQIIRLTNLELCQTHLNLLINASGFTFLITL